ncbi:MAG: aspartate/tyrosine/aromatic aminotransferase [Acidobacteriota bacterium]
MFEEAPLAPPDPIFGLAEAYRADPRSDKINLGIGVFRDDRGRTPIMQAVRRAAEKICSSEATKTYLPIEGDPAYIEQVQMLLWGDDNPLLRDGCLVTAQTPGGTGAISVAASFVKRLRPQASAWVSRPTWVNHSNIFETAGITVTAYDYLNHSRRGLAFDRMMDSLGSVSTGDVVVLHGCCHNPSGVDPNEDQWRQIAALMRERGALPLIDLAYQGFGDGLEGDLIALDVLGGEFRELIVCSSFSKNFALYNERVGALSVITPSAESARAVLSQLKTNIRVSYSNPPAHGAAIVATILADPELREIWQQELAEMRSRIQEMRQLFARGLDDRKIRIGEGSNRDFLEHRGMFSFTGIEKSQVEELRSRHGIYMLDSSRINFAALTSSSIDRVCDALATVATMP